jgi:hypothetical protein
LSNDYGFSLASTRIVAAMALVTVASARLCAAASASKLSPDTGSFAHPAITRSANTLSHRMEEGRGEGATKPELENSLRLLYFEYFLPRLV